MIIGIGTDALEIERMALSLKRRGAGFERRVFTDGENAYCKRKRDPSASYAARFAAKEATLKALGRGLFQGVTLKEIEVVKDPRGKPDILLHGGGKKLFDEMGGRAITLSLTHSRDIAFAVVIFEGEVVKSQ
jgi:holo-[acyl-carrier protein] synthase